MDQFNAIFAYIPRCRIIVCRECRIGVLGSHVASHLNTRHAYLVPSTRASVTQVARGMEALAEHEDEVVYPELVSEPVPHIPVWRDGLKCIATKADGTLCGYIRRTVQDIQWHCRNDHGWKNSRKRGRVLKGQEVETNKMWIEGICCQKFAHAGRLGRLFEVQSQDRAEDSQGDEEDGPAKRRVEVAFQQTTTALEKADKDANARIEPESNRYITHAWLSRTKWAHHLGRLDRGWLLALTHKPKQNEKALTRVCLAVKMVIWRAQQASCAKVVGFPAMNYINRREMGSDTNEKPFNARQTRKTMLKYSGCWLSIVRYIWRTHELEEVAAHATEGDEESKGERDGDEDGDGGRIREKRL